MRGMCISILLSVLLSFGAASCLQAGFKRSDSTNKIEYTTVFKQACKNAHIDVQEGVQYIVQKLKKCRIQQSSSNDESLEDEVAYLNECLDQLRLELPSILNIPLDLNESSNDSHSEMNKESVKVSKRLFWESLGFLGEVAYQLEKKIDKRQKKLVVITMSFIA